MIFDPEAPVVRRIFNDYVAGGPIRVAAIVSDHVFEAAQ